MSQSRWVPCRFLCPHLAAPHERKEDSARQAMLHRGAGIDVVWPRMLFLGGIGGVLFAGALLR